MPFTEGDMAVANARQQDVAAKQAGDDLRRTEELSRSNPASAQGRGVNNVREQQEQWLTDRIAQELGGSQLDALTIPNINPIRERIGKEFDRVLRRNDDDFTIQLQPSDVQALQAALDDVPDAMKTGSFNKAAERLAELAGGGDIPGKEFNAVRQTLNETRDRLIGKSSTYDAGLALDEAETVLLDRLRSSMSPEDAARFDELRGQWKMVKVLEGAARSTDAAGTANPSTIRNTYRRLNPLAKKGFDKSAIWNDIQIAEFVTNKAGVNNSGTADRLLPAILGTGAAAGGAGVLGGIFGG
jgi:hypothetical protein